MSDHLPPSAKRVLLIAYEYPPSPSPQSLRWTYLSRELSLHGHRVEVLTIDLGGTTPGLPTLPDDITIHRTFPGPFRGLIASRRKRREMLALKNAGSGAQAASSTDASSNGARANAARPSRGGWKHRVSMFVQNLFERFVFPDLRGEWYLSARKELRKMLHTFEPDVVISSHEPATTLQLGLMARRRGIRWIADLGDPVLAPYTPERWRRKSAKLEAAVCMEADHVLVTAESARQLLLERHGVHAPITVLTQGFDDRRPGSPPGATNTTMELLYTGSFYSFRRVDALLEAVLATPGLRLNIASIVVPQMVREASEANPERIRLLGFLPHDDAVAWQRRADVLVNLANADPMQVPGKFYEYLGSGRPILHLGENDTDAAARLVMERRRGWICQQQSSALRDRLRSLVELHAQGTLTEGLSLHRESVAEFGWSALGARLARILEDFSPHALARGSRDTRPDEIAR
ncbi:glycosyltransferase [Lysobacter auxotrophicus]|uniref:Glycosyltransferase n=1 Tax=Lysobacter auxotrophicus TaxID=2992573 RepID=A0ABN6UHP2_9GAMM|nr:glycosyltransferase [Lysobacter auxotrophicus]BDU15627.1 glycosyltransferase [Lysobacter auxotrophicus]